MAGNGWLAPLLLVVPVVAGSTEPEAGYQSYLDNLSAYQPTYFLVGADPRDSKFQFSLKYRLIGPGSEPITWDRWWEGTHFGYTQTSFWDLRSDSKPFDDSSYKPELFWRTPLQRSLGAGIRAWYGQIGVQHESNGRGGLDSRSTNIVYAKALVYLPDVGGGFKLSLGPRVWTYLYNDDDTNADLEDYRGFADLEARLDTPWSLVWSNHLYWAGRGGSWQADWTYPLDELPTGGPRVYLQLQYADVLAETLLDYRQRRRVWRLGLALVR